MIIFIPIKEHSERVPHKNFRILGEEELFLRQVNKFRKNYHVYVDTDSDIIIEKLNDLDGVTAYRRNEKLVGDDVSVNLLIGDFINRYNIDDFICQIHTTSPFLSLETIEIQDIGENDSIVSCDIIRSRIWKKDSIGMVPVNHNPMKLDKTQDLNEYYVENSTFYIFDSKTFLKYRNRIGINPKFVEVLYPDNVDIDIEDDWEYVKKIYEYEG